MTDAEQMPDPQIAGPQDLRCWWSELNDFLAAMGQTEALFGDARYWRDAGFSPAGAAEMIAEERSANDTEGR